MALLAPLLFGPTTRVDYGGARADLVVELEAGPSIDVEVKATGSGEFQEVKPRDLLSDALVWVAFGRRYELGAGVIDVFVLPRPERFAPPLDRKGQPRRKFTLELFLAQAKPLDGFAAWRLADIKTQPQPLGLA